MNSRLRAMLAVLFSTSALACAQVPAPKTESAPPAPPQNAAEARKAIAQARKELGDSLVEAPTNQAGPAVPPAPTTAVTAPTAGASKAGATEDKDLSSGGGAASAEATSSSCPRRCEASRSLDRATQALCELVGEEDAECKEARAAALRGEQAVALCSCR
jgi:hypothetical protein